MSLLRSLVLILCMSCGLAMPYARLHQQQSRRLHQPAAQPTQSMGDLHLQELGWLPLPVLVTPEPPPVGWAPRPEEQEQSHAAPALRGTPSRAPPVLA